MPRGTNSQSIRDYLHEHPGSTTREVIEGLAEQGIKVSGNLVANVKHKLLHGAGRGLTRVLRTWSENSPAVRAHEAGHLLGVEFHGSRVMPAEHILAAHESAKRVGGIARLREAVETLEVLRA